MQQFDDIRPYNDDEVPTVVARLVSDPEFIAAIARFRLPRLQRFLPALAHWLVARGLAREAGQIRRVSDLQHRVEPYLSKVLERTSGAIEISGLDRLPRDRAYLFLSNHRDIVMDPALVNYALHHQGRETVQIAIGDNLLGRPFVSDLMRLNKSFIVKRSVSGRREKLQAMTQLSAYINHCIQSGQPVWIAQSEGRAKDGNDRTDSALIKMLQLSQRGSGLSFAEFIASLHIVPVSISYEFDPCDRMKAIELEARAREGAYEKAEGEDLTSIVRGIMGEKGRVRVHFGHELEGQFEDAHAVAAAVDAQILTDYQLYPSNWAALQRLQPEAEVPLDEGALGQAQQQLEARLEGLSAAQQNQLIAMYAQPVINQLALS